ncbi:penicillin acylase family protein [Fodinicola feengrottensis]|uniref:Penicillin acylase family protein n=1 Tax=Fodinicola feengrottensis TaxID=435914 RepID=A0ABN2H465_9ACTN
MFGRLRILMTAALAVACVVAGLPASAAPPKPAAATDYCQGQCNDILPPGENGNATLLDILGNRTIGTRPAHTDDQLGPYAKLASQYTGLTNGQLNTFFDNSSFGVPADQVASTISPRSDVTIVRDKATGVPHITGTTRSGTEFGAGYAGAADRLWTMDLLRHVGRATLTGFAGGAPSNRSFEQSLWAGAPYTEQDLQAQIDRLASSSSRGQQALADVNDYVAGVNAYITQAVSNRNFPGEYVLTGHMNAITNAGSIDPFKPTDLIAIAAVIGALFGSGGGNEIASAQVKEAAEARYGVAQGDAIWQSLRMAEDPSAVQTVHNGQSFPYGQSPAHPVGTAMPDPGSVTAQGLVENPTGSATNAKTAKAPAKAAQQTSGKKPNVRDLSSVKGIFNDGVFGPGFAQGVKHSMSNAMVVSGPYTDTGNPVAVFGPQTGYFAPQLLMLEELQGPGISARGIAFAGISLYVLIGRGQDYSWSATSAGQDVTDSYAVTLCEPTGAPVTQNSLSYLYNGQCVPMERLAVHDAWAPNTADSTAAGSYDLVRYRTKYGLVSYRGKVGGQFVAFTSLRSSYMHEADSILGFGEFNDPSVITSPQAFQRAAADINFTFNWFYVDSKHTAYFNSGANPLRAANVDPNFPVQAQAAYQWQGWNPATNTAQYTPASQHPQSIDQDYYVSWNNKQAAGFAASDYGQGSVHRVDLLDSRIKAMVTSGQKVSRASLAKAMEDAALTDLRAEDVLPVLLQVLDSAPITDPDVSAAVAKLRAWQQAGGKRQETSYGSQQYASADAIRILDAWWPLLVKAEFSAGMGDSLYQALASALPINESPSGQQNGDVGGGSSLNDTQPHKGSSFQNGWWSYVNADLHQVLGHPLASQLGTTYCGGGNLASCQQALVSSLKQAAAMPATQVYAADADCSAGDQWCADTIIQHPLGGITDGKISWQNRPTYQQVVQFPSGRG